MRNNYLLKTNIMLALLFMMNHPLVSAAELNGGNDIAAGSTVTNTASDTTVSGSLDNKGIIDNRGTLYNNYGIINNNEIIDNRGTLYNHGTIYSDGTIYNDGTIDNRGTLYNHGIINNDGTLYNHETINNSRTVNNRGTISNDGTVNNHGTISNYRTLNNTGIINNYGPISGTGAVNINAQGTLINQGTITSTGVVVNKDGTFENDRGGSIGTLAVADGGTLTVLDGTVSSATNSGTANISGGTITDLNLVGGKLIYTGGTVTNLTSLGGTINLYNNNTASYTNLALGSFSGSATAIVHTDIANSTGDRFTISSVTSPSVLTVAVGYDPALSGITSAKTIRNTGYNIVSGSMANLVVNARTSEYGAYAITPLISSSGTFTGFSVDASTNTVGAASAGVRQGQMVQVSMNHLRKRLGELRNDGNGENGAWVRTYGGEINTNKYGRNDSSYSGLQVGYDKKQASPSGEKFTGGAVSYTASKDSFDTGSGNSYDTDFALYQTWVRKDGHYTDLILKHGWLESKYSMTDLSGTYSSADYNTQTDSISAEYGYRKQLKDAWYIEPQTELTYAHIGGASYATSSGLNVAQDGIDRLIWRNGIGIGRKLNNGNHIYASLSALHEFKGDAQIRANNFTYNETMDGTWGEFILGVDAKLSGHSSGYMNVEKLFGGDVGSNWQYNMGCRFTF